MSKKILYLTTANLPTNPRLLKEIDLFTTDYSITVIQFKLGNWSDAIDEELRKSRPHVTFFLIDSTRKHFLSWFLWAFLEKVAQLIYPYFNNSILLAAMANSRRAVLLYFKGLNLKKPDIIFGHNLAALYPCRALSKKWGIPFVFDVEDYHPGEFIMFDAVQEKSRREFLMKKLLPEAKAITIASPLIEYHTLELIDGHPHHQVVLNSFPQSEFVQPSDKKYVQNIPIRLVWFSQKVSFGRGLEQFFEALEIAGEIGKGSRFEVTLIGDLDKDFEEQILKRKIKCFNELGIEIILIPPLLQSELHSKLAEFDIGLALEFNNADLNRQLCLTNKIIAYAQAGLYILATNTPAQIEFIHEDPLRGIICGQTSTEMAEALTDLNLEMIQMEKSFRFEKGKSLSWEQESKKIKSNIEKI